MIQKLPEKYLRNHIWSDKRINPELIDQICDKMNELIDAFNNIEMFIRDRSIT